MLVPWRVVVYVASMILETLGPNMFVEFISSGSAPRSGLQGSMSSRRLGQGGGALGISLGVLVTKNSRKKTVF